MLTDDQNAYCKQVDIKQKEDGWVSTPDKIAGTLDVTAADSVGAKLGKTYSSVFVCVAKDGTLSLEASAPAGSKKLS